VLAEVLLIAFVYGVGTLIVWRQYVALDTATWYATPSAEGSKLSLAGIWYGYVSVPIFQFLLCRWYFRLFIWTRFLWQVSRIGLSLVPTHPDRVGGLSFLSNTVYAFAVLAVAHGALLAGQLLPAYATDRGSATAVRSRLAMAHQFANISPGCRRSTLKMRFLRCFGIESSSPRESHPQALPEPDVNLSIHPAPSV
jgi:hypothetical protein